MAHTVLPLAGAILVACASVCCTSGHGTNSTERGGTGGTGGWGGGAGGSGGVDEIPECARDFREPDPCSFELEYDCSERVGTTICGGLRRLPPDSNGECSGIFWLSGDERVCLTVTAYLGWSESFPPPRAPLEVTLWLDGIMVPFGTRDESPGLHYWANADNVLFEQELCLPVGVPGDGVHVLNTVLRVRDRRSIATLAFATPLVRNNRCLEDLPITDVEPAASYPALNRTYDENGEELQDVGRPGVVQDGQLDVTTVIDQGIDLPASLDGFLVAVLDGEQIPLGQLGPQPRLRLLEGQGNAVAVPIRFEGLPEDGQDHWIELLWLSGYGSIDLRDDGFAAEFPFSQSVGAFHLIGE